MEIKLLSKDVINQISAGEVVEKPASIVKELVENSIDAGADNIVVEIKNGGIDYIAVTDNGCGIEKSQVELAFMPHATSKLEKIDDLDTLSTMGFRGEALATIGAVSKVRMLTKTQNSDTGIEVKLEGGTIVSKNEIACVTGTKIEVSNIFYNTPARLKFLRKPKSEEGDISTYVQKLILSHCNISFKYIVDGKIIYNTTQSVLIDNIYTIYGSAMVDALLEVDYSIGNYKVYGYISKPEISKANRTYQNLFVNNRFCNNSLVGTAISNAYENFAMKGKFPMFVLFLELPQNELDVNVHPNKLEVKFFDTKKIYQLFNDAVFKALSEFNHILPVISNDENIIINDNCASMQNSETNKCEELSNKNIKEIDDSQGISYSSAKSNDEAMQEYLKNFKDLSKNSGNHSFNLTDNVLPPDSMINISIKNDVEHLPEVQNNIQANYVQADFKNVFDVEYRVVGKCFNTYLILEFEDKIYFIDQHAAHERDKFNILLEQLNNNNLSVQTLAVPYLLKVNSKEAGFVSENLDALKNFGIDICEFGYNSFKVSSVPMILAEMDLGKFFTNMLENINGLARDPKDVIRDKFAQMACKSAVKGGDDLSESEIKALLKTIKEDIDVLLCPHGRPIVVVVDKKQIEKWFKRIV
ncbi:MAG: DNA mismatch repair endonuclease MutL [Clostridiales bacterium]|nr:DNA mismatch repair endonuclease MutL [Clostridiales bacterium]